MKKIIVILLLFIIIGILIRPPVNEGKVTSAYGVRLAFGNYFHWGTDIGLPIGEPVSCISWGTVTNSGFHEQKGNFIWVNHFPGFQSRYLHLDSINVSNGQKVSPHTLIGTVGSTGISTGPHLHYEKRLFGVPLPPYLIGLPGKLLQKIGAHDFVDSFFKNIS